MIKPDISIEKEIEKYTEKNERYKFFVNEETERTEIKLKRLKDELHYREKFRQQLKELRTNMINE